MKTASLKRRFGAAAIDFLLELSLLSALLVPLFFFLPEGFDRLHLIWIGLLSAFLISFLYSFVLLSSFGATVGYFLLGLRARMKNGSRLACRAAFLRSLVASLWAVEMASGLSAVFAHSEFTAAEKLSLSLTLRK